MPNGMARPTPNPSMPMAGPILTPLPDVSLSKPATIGPVQEKETITSVSAIKNTPVKPPRCEASSVLFAQLEGRPISNAPKNEMAKMMNTRKKRRLLTGWVLTWYINLSPKNQG